MHGTHTESTSGNKPTCAITIQNSETKDQQTIMSSWRTWWRLVPRLALVVVVGALCFYTLIQLAHILLNMQVPHTIQQVQSIAVQLDDMTHHGTWSDYFAVVVVFAAIYLWQQAFSMPGSVLFNLLAGQLYGVVVASIWTSYLTALGSLLAYFLGRWVIGPSVLDVPCVKRRVGLWEEQMDQERKSIGLFWWLLFIRLLPFSPYWFINLASPLVGVHPVPFFWSTFLGSMPYNYICAQAGEVLDELTTTTDIFTVPLMVKLLVVSLVSLIPLIWGKSMQNRFQKRVRQDEEEEQQ